MLHIVAMALQTVSCMLYAVCCMWITVLIYLCILLLCLLLLLTVLLQSLIMASKHSRDMPAHSSQQSRSRSSSMRSPSSPSTPAPPQTKKLRFTSPSSQKKEKKKKEEESEEEEDHESDRADVQDAEEWEEEQEQQLSNDEETSEEEYDEETLRRGASQVEEMSEDQKGEGDEPEDNEVAMSQLLRATESQSTEPHSMMGHFQGVSQTLLDRQAHSTYLEHVSTIYNGKPLTQQTVRALESLTSEQAQAMRTYTLMRQDCNGWITRVFCMWTYMLKSKGEWPAHQVGNYRDVFLTAVYGKLYTSNQSKGDGKKKPKYKYNTNRNSAGYKRDLGMGKIMAIIYKDWKVSLLDCMTFDS